MELDKSKTLAFLVIKNDTILYQKYFDSFSDSSISAYFSMSKSVMSLLVGCAIDDDLIHSENDKVTKYIPELTNNGFDAVTIRDLLQMIAPIDYDEVDNPFGKHSNFYYSDNLEKEILKLTTIDNASKKFVYRSCNTTILGLILSRQLKKETISEYLQRKVWERLGCEINAKWIIDHENDGIEKVWCCLAGSAKDFAKIGRLYLNSGNFGDTKIVSDEWISQTITPLVNNEIDMTYNYSWWLYPKMGLMCAIGKDGQFCAIYPKKKVIIVRLGRSMGKKNREQWIELFNQIHSEI